MPVSPTSELKTISVIVTREQDRRIRARRDMLDSPIRRVSISDTYREVIEAGLDALLQGPNSISIASTPDGKAA